MKDQITRAARKGGKFATITNEIMNNRNLSTDARFLMLVITNNDPTKWELNFCHYRKTFSWSKKRMTDAKAELEENGYLLSEKANKGFGLKYYYLVDENGKLRKEKNLQPEKDMPLIFTGETTQSGFKVAKFISDKKENETTSMEGTGEIISHHDLLKHFKENFPDYAGYDLLDFKEKIKYKLVSTYDDVNKYIETNKITV